MNGTEHYPDWRHNALLARLPSDEYENLMPRLQPTEYRRREEIQSRDQPIEYVHFPLDAVFSVVESVDDRAAVEVSTIGNDGVVGLPAFLGTAGCPQTTRCQVSGTALRLPVPDLFEVLADDGVLHRLFQLYAQVLIAQLSRNVVCHRRHSAALRASRWLLITQDRVDRESFPLTQEFLAQMVGVRRATVSAVASGLADDGLIRYSRGLIEILDRPGLQATTCECYEVLRQQRDQLLNS